MIKRLEITPQMEDALAIVARAEHLYRAGVDGYSFLELPKLALADATLAAIRAAERRRQQRDLRLAKLPARAKLALTPVVDVTLRPKRRRA